MLPLKTTSMQIHTVCDARGFLGLKECWNQLAAGNPFRSWEWMHSWWHTLGGASHHQLMLLKVCDAGGQVIGLAPWYVDRTLARGNVIRMLGSGKATSDYQDILCVASAESDVASALASWLTNSGGNASSPKLHWDLLDVDGVSSGTGCVPQLMHLLEQQGCTVEKSAAESCWRIQLGNGWDNYLAGLKSDYRYKLRKLSRRYIDSGRLVWSHAETDSERLRYLESLYRLHTARRQSLGCSGCFAFPGFAEFMQHVGELFADKQQLWLTQLEIDGEVVANAIAIHAGDTAYLYQSGFDPQWSQANPGWLQSMCLIRDAIDHGCQVFDFLRGDEPYKKHLGGEPESLFRWRATGNSKWSQTRSRLISVVRNRLSNAASLTHGLSSWTAPITTSQRIQS